jgi:ammonium transporter, Amt family
VLGLQNLLNTSVATIVWLVIGYGVYSHGGPALFGTEDVFFPSLSNQSPATLLVSAMLASTTSNLVSGAVAERIDARAYLLVVALQSAIIFPVVARSVWYPQGAQRTETGPSCARRRQ